MPSKQEAMERTNRDVDAELAVAAGSAEILAAYFRDIATPAPNVLQSLFWCLVGIGAGNQTLRFKRRSGGRPPKKAKSPSPIDCEAVGVRTFSVGDERVLALYLDRGAISNEMRRLLAATFSSKGATIYKLVFKRARAGNPVSDLRTELEKAHLGLTAKGLKKQRGTSWDKVDDELYLSGRVQSADNTKRKRAVSFVKKGTSRR
jgi:hypothetical protein